MQVVVRALRVIQYLGTRTQGVTLGELSDHFGVAPATMHRLMAVLTEHEFAVRTGDSKQFSLGPAALSLAQATRHVADVARPHMQDLSASTGETVFLTELVGRRAVCVALVDGTRPLRLFVRVGQELPLNAAASARVLLAFQGEAQIDELLEAHDLMRFGPGTPTTSAAIKAHLVEVVRQDYDLCDGELDANVVAVAAPIRGREGDVVASLTAACPSNRMDPLARKRLISLVQDAAARISAGIGYSPPLRPGTDRHHA